MIDHWPGFQVTKLAEAVEENEVPERIARLEVDLGAIGSVNFGGRLR